MPRTRILFAAVAVAAVAALGTGCSQKYTAERDGKKLGQAVCDLRNAKSADDVSSAKNDISKQLNDIGNKYAIFTAEDRKDIENNLADLAEHAVQGNSVLINQDLTVLRRSASHVAEDNYEISSAVWDGFHEGLAGCDS